MIRPNVRTSDFKDWDDVSEVGQPSDTDTATYSPLPARSAETTLLVEMTHIRVTDHLGRSCRSHCRHESSQPSSLTTT